ncbi:hypothetical protein, partial [Aeromonas veronii]
RQGATVDQGMIVSLFPVNAIWVNSYKCTGVCQYRKTAADDPMLAICCPRVDHFLGTNREFSEKALE